MILFLWLLLAHLLYDFHWQGDFVGQMKSKYKFILGVHALTYALVMWGTLTLLGVSAAGGYLALEVFFITHYIIDAMKAYNWLNEPPESAMTFSLWVDQALHLIIIVLVAFGGVVR